MAGPDASWCVVAGAAGGIGRAIAQRLGAAHPLLLLDRDADGLEEVRYVVEQAGGHARCGAADLSDGGAVERVFALHSDVRIGSVAVAVGTTTAGSLHETSDEDWATVLDSCLTTVFTVIRAAVRAMPQGGSICVLGSVHASAPVPGYAAYAAAKAGVTALVRQVAGEYGQHRIRANLVTPGWTETPHTLGRLSEHDRGALLDATPLRDLVQPDDIAAAVEFLLGPQAARITGADLVVDAGGGLLPASSLLRDSQRATLGLPALP